MSLEAAAVMAGVGTIALIILTLRAISGHTWHLMWAASLASLLVSAATILSVGAILFLPSCLQIGATLAMRRNASGREWLVCLGIAAFVWLILVPGQIIGGPWLGSLGNLAFIGLLGLTLPLLPFVAARSRST